MNDRQGTLDNASRLACGSVISDQVVHNRTVLDIRHDDEKNASAISMRTLQTRR